MFHFSTMLQPEPNLKLNAKILKLKSLMKSLKDKEEGDKTAQYTTNFQKNYFLFFPEFLYSMSVDINLSFLKL